MADMSHRLPDATTEGWNSRYARMIPGTSGTPQVAVADIARNSAQTDINEPSVLSEKQGLHHSPLPHWLRFLLPRTQTADRLALYQLTILDLLVLLASCLLPSVLFPAWSLPQLATPVYAVLVILFAFSEGLYNNVGQASATEFPVLARSAFFAMSLVLVAAWNVMQPVAALIAFATSLTGLILWCQIRRMGWSKHFRETEPRNVLIVGAGSTARAIAKALREDPLHPSTVVGFLDDHVTLSPEVLGRIADLDWLARSQFIDEVILAVPNDPKLVRKVYRSRVPQPSGYTRRARSAPRSMARGGRRAHWRHSSDRPP